MSFSSIFRIVLSVYMCFCVCEGRIEERFSAKISNQSILQPTSSPFHYEEDWDIEDLLNFPYAGQNAFGAYVSETFKSKPRIVKRELVEETNRASSRPPRTRPTVTTTKAPTKTPITDKPKPGNGTWKPGPDNTTGTPVCSNKGEESYICRYCVDDACYHGAFFGGLCRIWEKRLEFKNLSKDYEIFQESSSDYCYWKASASFPKGLNLVLGTYSNTDASFVKTYIVRCKDEKGCWTAGHGPEHRESAYYIAGDSTAECSVGYEYLICDYTTAKPTPAPPTGSTGPTEKPGPETIRTCVSSWKADAKTGFVGGETGDGKPVYICRHKIDNVYYHGPFKNDECLIWTPRLHFKTITSGYELLDSPQGTFKFQWRVSMLSFPMSWTLVVGTDGTDDYIATYVVKCRVSGSQWEVGHAPVQKPYAYYLQSNNTAKCTNGYAYLTCYDVGNN